MKYVRGVVGKGGLRMTNCDGLGLGSALVFWGVFWGMFWGVFWGCCLVVLWGPSGQSEPRTGPVLEQNSASLKAQLAQFKMPKSPSLKAKLAQLEGKTRPA